MTKMLKILLLPLISVSLFAEWPGDSWQLHSVFKAYDSPRDNGYGIHGTVVAPDGNIWVAIQGGMAGDSLAHTFTAQDGSDSAGLCIHVPFMFSHQMVNIHLFHLLDMLVVLMLAL